MISPGKFMLGAAGASALAGMYTGIRTAPEDSGTEDKIDRGAGVAGTFAFLGAGAAAAGYAAASKFSLKGAASGLKNRFQASNRQYNRLRAKATARAARATHLPGRMVGPATQGAYEHTMQGVEGRMTSLYRSHGSTLAFAGVGAGVGAIIGGAVSKGDRTQGAAKGAAIGAGVGVVAKGVAAAALKYSSLSAGGKKAGGLAGLVLASAAIYGGVRAATRAPEPSTYGETDAAGQTQYSDTSVADRARMMNASGDMVFGLHNMRH
jgi:hypothetical protein